jgi:hypothetical protein
LQRFLPVIGPVALFILWDLVVRMGFIKPILLPTPMATLETLVNGLAGGKLLTDFAVTVMRTLQSFLIGSALALPASLADRAYASIKQDIFAFRLIPGDRFSENAVAERLGMSRTRCNGGLSNSGARRRLTCDPLACPMYSWRAATTSSGSGSKSRKKYPHFPWINQLIPRSLSDTARVLSA